MSSVDQLNSYQSLSVQQTLKGCFQELLGCEANTEFRIATLENKTNYVMHAQEHTECWKRFFCANMREWDFTLSAGSGPGGAVIAQYHREFRCMPGMKTTTTHTHTHTSQLRNDLSI